MTAPRTPGSMLPLFDVDEPPAAQPAAPEGRTRGEVIDYLFLEVITRGRRNRVEWVERLVRLVDELHRRRGWVHAAELAPRPVDLETVRSDLGVLRRAGLVQSAKSRGFRLTFRLLPDEHPRPRRG